MKGDSPSRDVKNIRDPDTAKRVWDAACDYRGVPVDCNDCFRRRKVPRAGFAAAQDDMLLWFRESSHAFAYFQDT